MASLVQDVFLGFEPRLRARRLAPWAPPAARLLFQLDPAESLDEPQVACLLETLAERIEVIAWEPRRQAVAAAEMLERYQQLVQDGAHRFGERALFAGGSGLGAWIALATAMSEDVAGVVALAPSLSQAGAATPQPSPLRAALSQALADAPPLERPALLLEGCQRPVAESLVVDEWLAEAAHVTRLLAPGADTVLYAPPWPQVIATWVEALGRETR